MLATNLGAVLLAELYECLAEKCITRLYASVEPRLGVAVVLGGDILEKVYRFVGKLLVVSMVAVSVDDGGYKVDTQKVALELPYATYRGLDVGVGYEVLKPVGRGATTK